MSTIAKLKTNIQTDPAVMGYSGKTDQEVLDLLTAKTRTRNKILSSKPLLKFVMAESRLDKIKDASVNHASPAIRSVCLGALIMLNDPEYEFDPDDSDSIGLLNALVGGGVWDSVIDKDALLAKATENISRMEEIEISGRIGPTDIQKARA